MKTNEPLPSHIPEVQKEWEALKSVPHYIPVQLRFAYLEWQKEVEKYKRNQGIE